MRNVLQASRRIGSDSDVARVVSLSELGFIAEQRGDLAIARSRHLQSLASATKLGDPQAVAQALTGLAGVRVLCGQADRAAQLLGAADTACRPAGASMPPDGGPDAERITTATRQALGEAAFDAGFQDGRRLRPEQAAALLPCPGSAAGPGSATAGSLPATSLDGGTSRSRAAESTASAATTTALTAATTSTPLVNAARADPSITTALCRGNCPAASVAPPPEYC